MARNYLIADMQLGYHLSIDIAMGVNILAL